MKNIFRISLCLLAALFAVSCAQEEGTLYENPEGKTYVSLASNKYIADLTPDDGTQINVTVQRNTTHGNLDVPFHFRSSDALFVMSDTVAHFADGQSVTHLTISYPGSDLIGIGTTYTLTVSIADPAMLSVGGVSQQTFTLKRRVTWVDIGTGTWKDGIVSAIFTVSVLTYDVVIQETLETDGLYRLVNPYGLGVYYYTEAGDVVSDPCYVIINAVDPDKVTIPQTGIGIDYGYGEFLIASKAYGTRNGNKITFPAQSIAVGMRNYSGGNLAFNSGECILTLP